MTDLECYKPSNRCFKQHSERGPSNVRVEMVTAMSARRKCPPTPSVRMVQPFQHGLDQQGQDHGRVRIDFGELSSIGGAEELAPADTF